MRYNPRLHCSAGCLRADGRATSEPYQMRVRPSRGPGGRGRRGRAGGHGATSSRARHERIGGGGGVRGGGGGPRWRALTRSLIRARAAPDHTAAPAPRSPGGLQLTSHLCPLTSWAAAAGPAREGSSANSSSFSNLFCCRTKRCGSDRREAVQRLSTLDFRGCGPQQTCPAAAHKHRTCLRTIVTFCIVSIFGQLQVKRRQWRALPTRPCSGPKVGGRVPRVGGREPGWLQSFPGD